MKKVLFNLLMFALFMLAFLPSFAQGDLPVEDPNWIVIIITAIIGVVEVISRAVPGKFSGLVGLIVNLLKFVSDYLNREKT